MTCAMRKLDKLGVPVAQFVKNGHKMTPIFTTWGYFRRRRLQIGACERRGVPIHSARRRASRILSYNTNESSLAALFKCMFRSPLSGQVCWLVRSMGSGPMMGLLQLLLLIGLPVTLAPWGLSPPDVPAPKSGRTLPTAATVAAASTAAIAALGAIRRVQAGTSVALSAAAVGAAGPRVEKRGADMSAIEEKSTSEDETEEEYDSDACCSCCSSDAEAAGTSATHAARTLPAGVSRVGAKVTSNTKANGKLWSKAQFPEGNGAKCCDMANLVAAQAWICPCLDRVNCIGQERLPNIFDLYEHRKKFQSCNRAGGGMRDGMRDLMANHYSSADKSLSRSFVVGPLNDCCAASAGLAVGLNFGSWAQSRADLRKERPKAAGRKKLKLNNESAARGIIDAHIRRLRSTYEGSKGKDTAGVWHTGKKALKTRWRDFVKERENAGLTVVGSEWLFIQVWKSHDEIKEFGACGHPVCDTCGKTQIAYDKLEGRTDDAAVQQRRDADAKQAQHDFEHRGERKYADDIWDKAELHPENVTALNFDAPTEKQFEVPVQKRVARDVAKKLENMQKWASKLTGVLVAGWGMLAFVARAGLGSGPNLSLTLLYLTLHVVQESGRDLGKRFSLLMDNTAADNKCALMVCFIGWLVLMDHFEDASFFCMLKGHTFTVLDQSFNTMISQLLAIAIYTLSHLIELVFKFLQPYGCRQVIELHQLWDWGEAFKPHMTKISGFCTSQFGSGMHECYVRKDKEGESPPPRPHMLALLILFLDAM